MVFVGRARIVTRVLCALAIVVAGCSGDESDGDVTATTTTVVPAPSSSTTRPAPVPAATVAEAEGWRLVVTAPEAGSRLGRAADVCYQVSGTSRESVVSLDVGLVADGVSTAAQQVPISVGRGGAPVDLSGTAPGVYDLHVQLVGDGAALAGVAVTIAGVIVDPGTTTASGCD